MKTQLNVVFAKTSNIFIVLVFRNQISKKMSWNTKSRFQCNGCQSDNSKAKSLEANITKGNDGKLEDIIKSIKFTGAQFDDFNVKIDSVLE